MAGVPPGYTQDWYYTGGRVKERKVKKGLWKGTYTNTKISKHRVRGGGPPVGSKIRWKWTGIQTATKVKTKPSVYKLRMTYWKRPLWFNNKMKRRRQY